jgi:hypothetical protein
VSLEQPAIQQPGKPLQEGIKAQARSLPEMMSDQRLALLGSTLGLIRPAERGT